MSKIIKGAAVEEVPMVLQLRTRAIANKQQQTQEVTVTAQDQAAAIIDEANAKATSILQQAEQQAAAMLDHAKAQGEELMHNAQQQGYDEGKKKAKTEGEKIRRQAKKVLEQAEDERRQTFETVEQEIITLAVEIAEKFLSTQLRLDPEIIAETAQQAIRLVKDRQRITMYVNPSEMGVYIGAKQQLEQMLSDQAVVSFIADAEVKSGGCLVDTEQGLVDATFDSRWQSVLKAIYHI